MRQYEVLVVHRNDGIWDAFCIEPGCLVSGYALTLAETPFKSDTDKAAAAHRKWHREDDERKLAAVPCPTRGRTSA